MLTTTLAPQELAEIRQALSDAKQENEALKAEVQTLRDQREELEDKMLEDDKAQSLEMKKKEVCACIL